MLLLQYDWFFSSWDVDNEVPIDKDMNPVSTINQELINKAENMGEYRLRTDSVLTTLNSELSTQNSGPSAMVSRDCDLGGVWGNCRDICDFLLHCTTVLTLNAFTVCSSR